MSKQIYNNFKSSKNYRKVVFTSGAKLQSAELNEMQDIQLNYTSKLGEFLVSTGTIIEGGEILSLNRTQIIISNSVISVQGFPVFTPEATIQLRGNEETLGILIEESIVQGSQDEDLLQPDPSSPFYREETSYRQKVVGRWIKANEVIPGNLFFPVMTIEEGRIISTSANRNDNRDYINKSISSYDKGVHGSYVVEGLFCKNINVTREDNKHTIELSSGLCRVNGDEVNIPTARLIALDPIVENTRTASAEPIIFIKDQILYTLRNTPPKVITSITGTKEVTKTINRGGSAGGEDTLPDRPVLRIVEVKQGHTTYRSGTDYIQVGDKISWTPGGEEPSPSSQYTVKYQYIDTFQGEIEAGKLKLKPEDSSKLVHNTQMSVSYEFYLSRIDRLIVKDKEIIVLKGIPETPSNVIPPIVDKKQELSLATIRLMYGMTPEINQDDTVYMIPFSDLKRMQDQLSDVQYNILQLSLKDEARDLETVTNKRGVIVDSLANESMRDHGVTQNAKIQNGLLETGSNFSTQKILNRQFVSLGTQLEYELFNQDSQTGEQRINPYARPSSAPQASCVVSPGIVYGNMWDPAYDGTELPQPFKLNLELSKFQNAEQVKIQFRGENIGNASTTAEGSSDFELNLPKGLPYSTYEVTATGLVSGAQAIGVFELKRNDETFNNFYTQLNLARQAEINAELQKQIDENRGNIESLREQLEQEIQERERSVQQITDQLESLRREWEIQQQNDRKERERLEGLLRSGQAHDAEERARIQRELNDHIAAADRRFRDQEARYKADQDRQDREVARLRGLQEERTRINTNSRRNWSIRTDPVAQSFISPKSCDISAVSVVLTELPTKPLYCKVVEVTAGQPDIFKMVGYGEIPTVEELKLGWNKIKFQSPISILAEKEYAVIIITESFEGKIGIAKVGEKDVNRGVYIKTQTDEGVMFLSANERTWSAVQDSDITYKLHAINYESTKTVKLGTITSGERAENLTDFRLIGQLKDSESTSAKFYMMVNQKRVNLALNRTIYSQPIKKNEGDIEVFVELNTTLQSSSPLINPGVLLLSGVANSPATYVSRQFPIKNGQLNPATINVVLDQLAESGCTITPYYQSGDTTDEFTEISTVKSREPIGNNWQTVVYEVKNVQRANTRLKLKLETSHHENRPKVKNIRILVLDNS